MSKRVRQYAGILSAVMIYYVIHEGAHLLYALFIGVFKQINFMGVGIQVDVYNTGMTDTQMGIFCLVGAIATLAAGWISMSLCKQICKIRSKVFRSVMWYSSLILLLLDPIYLSVLCGFFGGGDMNGIALLFPEAAVRMVFAVIGLINGVIVWRYLLPEYTRSFKDTESDNGEIAA
ncbi:MAG: hypothetical protein ACI4KF_02730 [Huintestinicola sp.]